MINCVANLYYWYFEYLGTQPGSGKFGMNGTDTGLAEPNWQKTIGAIAFSKFNVESSKQFWRPAIAAAVLTCNHVLGVNVCRN